MAQHDTATLVKLSDANLTVWHPDNDIRGRKVVDHNGDEIGEVDELLIDDREQKVRFMQVAEGGFLGIGETKFMIPVEAITRIADDTVSINQSRERVVGAPRYDPAIVRNTYWGDVYGYYGYAPYWGPGYVYPPYPYYP